MSWQALQVAWRREILGADRKPDPNAKYVYLYLAHRAAEDGGNAWPAVGTMERDTGLNRRTIQRKLSWLVRIGVIVMTETGGGRHKSALLLKIPADRANFPHAAIFVSSCVLALRAAISAVISVRPASVR